MDSVKDYRIISLVSDSMNDTDIEQLDFKVHLISTVSLNKRVFKNSAGRPSRAEYDHLGVLMAVIYFTFNVDENNLLLSRSESLKYILNDGSEGKSILIKSKVYDYNNLPDVETIVEERISSRKSIISGCKGFILGVLQQAGMSHTDALMAGAAFWDAEAVEINQFIEFGTETWRDALIALDLNTTPFTWLGAVIDANGATVRDYLVSRLTY